MVTSSTELDRLESVGWSHRGQLSLRDGVWRLGGSSGALSYPDTARRAISTAEDTSYWFRHRNRAVADLARESGVDGTIWDVGAGNGAVAAHLQRCGFDVVAVEPAATGAAIAAERGLQTVISGNLERLRLPDASVNAVGVFDVLEHLEEPDLILSEIARILVPDGVLLLTVPAYRWLWSHADVEAGHFRRYTARSLNADVLVHGFEPRRVRYLFHSLVPAVVLGRVLRRSSGGIEAAAREPDLESLIRQLRPRSRLIRILASATFGAEHYLDRILPLPFGTSLVAAYSRSA